LGRPIARLPRCRPRSAALLVALVLPAGCGGGHHARPVATHAKPQAPARTQTDTQATPAPRTFPADPRRVAIVRKWVATLRAGRIVAASRYFSVPVIVQNAGPAYKLLTPKAVRGFNASLPCGARVVRAVAGDKYTIVTFRLTERKNSKAGCGTGTGTLAATAFRFRHGRISEWIRVTPPDADAASTTGPVT